MYNLLDSHDTARFLYEAGGDKARLRLAVAMQMTFPGSPAIFYGDEIGLSGPNDPGCRMAMQWDGEKQDRQLLNWYRQLISLRLASDSSLSCTQARRAGAGGSRSRSGRGNLPSGRFAARRAA